MSITRIVHYVRIQIQIPLRVKPVSVSCCIESFVKNSVVFEKAEEIIEIFVHKCSLEKWIQFVSPKIHYLLLNMLNIILNSLNKGK